MPSNDPLMIHIRLPPFQEEMRAGKNFPPGPGLWIVSTNPCYIRSVIAAHPFSDW